MFPIRDTIPSRYVPWMTWLLIGLNSAIFLFQVSLPPELQERFIYMFGLVPARYSQPEWAIWAGLPLGDYWPFLTSMFLHGSWMHLIGNMWTLWIFGDNVEDRMGPWRYLAFYILCGLAAAVLHTLLNLDARIPTVGASGAISGVLGAYFLMFRHSQIIVMVPVLIFPFFFTIPATLYLLVWFGMQLLPGTASLFMPQNMGGVAWWAHVGGFIAGMVLYRLFLDPLRNLRFYRDQASWRTLF
ncbi:rhomboid family intramembrane serine protease [Hahella sp. SMD15-11]|uniref:Rhomboid family intramembrane serine protease n=1 Tax=Thermohahella caldifontis TaxID=3142973 RepID=A0AB39UVR5_9GAMM